MDSELQHLPQSELQKDDRPRKRGRPPKNDSNKKIRQTITLDPGAWEKICEIAKDLGYEGGSPFINDIGIKLSVTPDSQKSKVDEVFNAGDIPRIFSCLEFPASRLWSALSFIRSTCLALGLTKDIYENEALVEDVARKAMVALCLRSFFEPDNYIGNITGYMNWISWHILQAKANLSEAYVSPNLLNVSLPKSKEEEISPMIWRLVKSIELLRSNYPGEYLIFQMYMMERFSNKQIAQILELRQNEMTKENAYNKVKNVMQVFRKAWYDDASKNLPSQEVISEWKTKSMDVLKSTQKYLDLIRNEDLHDESIRKQVEQILLVSINRPLLDTFIREVDHAYGHDISKENKEYNEYQEKIRVNLFSGKNNLRQCFSDSLNELKSILVFSGSTRQEIYTKFMEFVRKKTETKNISESYFLKLKKFLLEEPILYTSEMSVGDKKELNKEAIADVCIHLAENQGITVEQLPLEKIFSNDTKVIFSCIENDNQVVCGPV